MSFSIADCNGCSLRSRSLWGCDPRAGEAHAGTLVPGMRYYSNGLGRFVSSDWSAVPVPVPYADFGDPQSLNLYAYVGGNPASKADPDGHCCDLPSWSDVGQFIAGVANAYGSDNLLGAGRIESNSLAYNMGHIAGDGAAAVSSAVETSIGLGGEGVGIALDATGVGAIAGVPINVASAGLIAHGATTTAVGGANLGKDAVNAFSDKTGTSGGERAGKPFLLRERPK